MNSGAPSDQPHARWDDSDPGNGGGFVCLRHDDPARAGLEAQYAARIRARLGDEAFELMERSRALGDSPRPLTDEEKAILREAVTPLLRDMEATGQAGGRAGRSGSAPVARLPRSSWLARAYGGYPR
jgi:hypothetical protein